MSAWRSGDAYGASRPGLSARSHLLGSQSIDQIQISIDPGSKFDFDREVEDLRGHVARIKGLSLAIDDERRQQGELIKNLEEALERAGAGLKRAMKRLNVAYRQAGSWHLLWLMLFAAVLFTVVYMLGKLYRLGAAVL